jgi:hypothetical protein
MSAVAALAAALMVARDRSQDRNWLLTWARSEGLRTPNLLIRSKIRFVQIGPSLSIWPAGTPYSNRAVPASSALVQIRC